MKREVNRERRLPAFRIDVADLGVLWQRCVALFARPEDVRAHCIVTLPGETLKFQSLEEITAFKELPTQCTRFELWFHQDSRHVAVLPASLFGSHPSVSAGGESESWCAGAVESVHSFLSNHKATYNWFATAPYGWLLFLFGNIAPIALFLAAKASFVEPVLPRLALYGWVEQLFADRVKVKPQFRNRGGREFRKTFRAARR